MPERMISPVEQSLQVNSFFLIIFNIEDPYHLFNFVGHDINCLAISNANIKKQPSATIAPVAGYIGINAMPRAEHKPNKTQNIICIISSLPFYKLSWD